MQDMCGYDVHIHTCFHKASKMLSQAERSKGCTPQTLQHLLTNGCLQVVLCVEPLSKHAAAAILRLHPASQSAAQKILSQTLQVVLL